ncbi:hypothetical protein [Kurthia massiliensis]|uniref:hypothetical protein n=1 Tax=Kurthia massiliensis TaxID=1033739 RepID=UPI000289032E|nr:hypothetical protein [Kurthia massiliensis]
MDKILKSAIAVAVGVSTISVTVGTVSAAEKYVVKKGKLVNAKTGKTVKGYVVYKGKLYKNGKKNKGYALVGKGSSLKLYYNTSLKKGYKTASNAKYLFKDGKLVKGFKQAGKNQRLYKNGVLTTGYKVYQAKDETLYLYYTGQLKQGLKTATYNAQTLLFKDGVIAKGDEIFKQKLYTDGVLNMALKQVGNDFYYSGVVANGLIEGAIYENGKLTVMKEEVAFNEAKTQFEAHEKELAAAKADYTELAALEALLRGENKATTLKLKALSDSDVSKFLTEMKGKDLSKLTAAEKAEILSKITSYKEEATTRLQTAINNYVATAEKLAETSKALAKVTSELKKAEEVQSLVKDVQTAIADLKESTKGLSGIKVESSKLETLLAEVEKVVAENPVVVEKPKEERPEEQKPVEEVKPTPTQPEVPTETPTTNDDTSGYPPVIDPPAQQDNNGQVVLAKSKQALEALLNTIQVEQAGNALKIGDKIVIDQQSYILSENPTAEKDTNNLYITVNNATSFLQKVEDAKKAMTATKLDDVEYAIKALNNAIYDLSYNSKNSGVLELETQAAVLFDNYLTDETDSVKVKADIEQQMNKLLNDGYKVIVEDVHQYEGEEASVEFLIENVATGQILELHYGISLFSTQTAKDYLEQEKTIFNNQVKIIKLGANIEQGDQLQIGTEFYNIVLNPILGEKDEKYVSVLQAQNVEEYGVLLNNYNEDNIFETLKTAKKLNALKMIEDNWMNELRYELKLESEKLTQIKLALNDKRTVEEQLADKLQKSVSNGFTVTVISIEKPNNNYVVSYRLAKDNEKLTIEDSAWINIVTEDEMNATLQAAKEQITETLKRLNVPADPEALTHGMIIKIDNKEYTISNTARDEEGPKLYFFAFDVEEIYTHINAAKAALENNDLTEKEVIDIDKNLNQKIAGLISDATNKTKEEMRSLVSSNLEATPLTLNDDESGEEKVIQALKSVLGKDVTITIIDYYDKGTSNGKPSIHVTFLAEKDGSTLESDVTFFLVKNVMDQ